MSVSITTKTAIVTAVTLLLLVGMGCVSFEEWLEQKEATAWVMHTYQVLTSLGQLRSNVQWGESNMIAYLLVGNPSYAREYRKVRPDVEKLLATVQVVTSDNPAQQDRVSQLVDLVHQNLRLCDEAMKERDEHGYVAATAKFEEKRGQHLISQIRSAVNQMKEEEGKLLVIRSEHLESVSQNALTLVAILIFTGGALLTAVVLVVRHYSEEQRRSQNSLQAAFNELKQAQQALRQSEASLSAILQSLGEGIFQLDAEGHIVYLNPTGERILGYRMDQVVQTPLHNLIHSELQEAQQKKQPECPFLANIAASSAGPATDDEFLKSDGSKVPVRYISAPLVLEGKPAGTVVSFEDITERKEGERRVTEFYSTVSHELRTPLTSIRAALGLMSGGMAGSLAPKAAQLVTIAQSECDRLIRLINDILDLRKIEAGKLELHRTNTGIEDLLNQACDAVSSLASESGITLEKKITGRTTISCDKDRIVQVLTNLLGNAIKFSPQGGTVTVAVEPMAAIGEKFSVIDNGPGIPEDKRHQLFARFQQLDSSDSRPKGGTGLGLAISRAIVEQHGGAIGVDSQEGKGSTFWFTLPSYSSSADIELPAPAAPAKNVVLLVEDDEHVALMVREMLAIEGYHVVWAPSVAQAEEYISKTVPSAVLLDIQLPDGNGLELMARLRSAAATQSVPVVILTGRQPDWKTYGEPLLIDWITKPLDERRLFLALKVAMLTRGSKPAKVLVVEDDLATRKLLVEQLSPLGVQCLEAANGSEALELARKHLPDLLILDVGIPAPDGFELVDILRQESSSSTPLLVYTSRDLTAGDMSQLTLGLSKHLVKSRTSESEFLSTVRLLLNGLIRPATAGTDSQPNLTTKE